MRSSSSNSQILLKTPKSGILIQSFSPVDDKMWFTTHSREKLYVNMNTSMIDHEKEESHYESTGRYVTSEVSRNWAIRRAKTGDWMRREVDTDRKGFDPCPAWIGEVLDTITEYLVNKTIVE